MFRADGGCAELDDLARAIPDNNLLWSVIEYEGVGKMPEGLTYADFQEKIRRSPKGVVFDWDSFRRFASLCEYTTDCLIVATKVDDAIDKQRLLADDYSDSELVLNVIDRTTWVLAAEDENLLRILASLIRGEPGSPIS